MKLHRRRVSSALALALLLPPAMAIAADTAVDGTGSYSLFLAYPHLDRGYAALRAGNTRTALVEFRHARELAPRSPRTALDLAQVYRQLGDVRRAAEVLAEQRRFTPDDPRLAGPPVAKPAMPDCAGSQRDRCLAAWGYAALRRGNLEQTDALLGEAGFARTTTGVGLRRSLVQRAIFVGARALAQQQLALLAQTAPLTPRERDQWLALSLASGAPARAEEALGSRPTADQELAVARGWSAAGDRRSLRAYLERHRPAFDRPAAEREWLDLLARSDPAGTGVLAGYRARFPQNRVIQDGLLLRRAQARGNDALARRALARLPAASYREARLALALRSGRPEQAGEEAKALFAHSPDPVTLDRLSYQLFEGGAYPQAARLLLDAYPFPAGEPAALLMTRLALLAAGHPRLFAAADRARLRQPLATPALRAGQVPVLVALGDCEGVRAVLADRDPAYPAASWRALGDCSRKDSPRLAEVAYVQASRRQPSPDNRRALAYQAMAVADYPTAMRAWQLLEPAGFVAADMLAAARAALALGDRPKARAFLARYAGRVGEHGEDYWWLRASAEPHGASRAARADLAHAIAEHPRAMYYARLAELQHAAGERGPARQSLERARALAPRDPQLAAQLGYALLADGHAAAADEAFEDALRARPADPVLTRQLAYVNLGLGRADRARVYAERAIDQLDGFAGPVPGDAATGQQLESELFNLRRLHEDAGRRWRLSGDLLLGDGMSAGTNAIAPGLAYRSYAQAEIQYRLQPFMPGADANTLAAYARVFAGSGEQGAFLPTRMPRLGIGVHWKPLRDQLIVVSAEQQIRLDNSRGNRYDTMLRVSASWPGAGRYAGDWHPTVPGWVVQNLYVDVARYLGARQTAFTLDYQAGYQRKLAAGQTIEPYARLQFNGIDGLTGGRFGHDLRAGLGLRWNIWCGQGRYDAYRHRVSVAVEWQHAFSTYRRGSNVFFLAMGGQW